MRSIENRGVVDIDRAKVQKISLADKKRLVVIGDIHGKCELLERLLSKVNYSSEDALIIVGDCIERGEENLDTLRYLLELSKQNDVFMLMGNNDYILNQARVQSDKELSDYLAYMKNSVLHEMLKEQNIPIDDSFSFCKIRQKLIKSYEEIFNWFDSLPHIIETEDYIFTHSGLTSNDLNEQDWHNTIRNNDFFLAESQFKKWLITGHMPTINLCSKIGCHNPIINEKRKVIMVDGGNCVKSEGQLNGFIIENHNENAPKFSFEAVDDLPIVTALCDQKASENPVSIQWYNGEIEIIQKDEKYSIVKHIQSKAELYVRTDYIRDMQGRLECHNATNYRLPVKKGDKLSYIIDFMEDCIVKKDGVVGLIEKNNIKI